MSFRQDGNEICVKYEQQKLVVKAIRDDIVNIFVPYRTKEHYSKAIDGDKAVAAELTAEQKGEDLVIATDKIRMQFGENLEMVITRPDGTPLVRTHRQGRSVCGEVSEQMKQILESEGHDTSNLGAHDYPVQMMFDLDEGDDFYGLGDKTGFLNKKIMSMRTGIPIFHRHTMRTIMRCTSRFRCSFARKRMTYMACFLIIRSTAISIWAKKIRNIIFTARMMAIWICTSWVEKN